MLNHPLFPYLSDFGALPWSPNDLYDVDKQKQVLAVAISHKISNFNISKDLENRFSSDFKRFSPLLPQMNA